MTNLRAVFSCLAAVVFLSLAPCGALAESMMLIVPVETTDAPGYAQYVKQLTALQQEAGAKLTTDVWVPLAAGQNVDVAFYVAEYASAKDWLQSSALMAENQKALALQRSMDDKRTITAATLYRKIRDDGEYPNPKALSTNVRPTDAEAYAKALDELDALLDKNGFEDIKLNVWAVTAGGELAGVQLVSLQAPNAERLGAFLDSGGQPWIQKWVADAASLRTLVSNGIYEQVSAD
jgi:hypothetical protein